MNEDDTFAALKSCSFADMRAKLNRAYSGFHLYHHMNNTKWTELNTTYSDEWVKTAADIMRRHGWTAHQYENHPENV